MIRKNNTSYKIAYGNKEKLLDEAWDFFIEYVVDKNISTPLNFDQFEDVFIVLNKDNKFSLIKNDILYSFQNDSYYWPLVKKK